MSTCDVRAKKLTPPDEKSILEGTQQQPEQARLQGPKRPCYKDFFMAMAFLSHARAKDSKYQVGACLVTPAPHRLVAMGYNGMFFDWSWLSRCTPMACAPRRPPISSAHHFMPTSPCSLPRSTPFVFSLVLVRVPAYCGFAETLLCPLPFLLTPPPCCCLPSAGGHSGI
ncbi:Deoxycytidylate deaminase, partial [Geodia barretti]